MVTRVRTTTQRTRRPGSNNRLSSTPTRRQLTSRDSRPPRNPALRARSLFSISRVWGLGLALRLEESGVEVLVFLVDNEGCCLFPGPPIIPPSTILNQAPAPTKQLGIASFFAKK